MHTTQFWLIRHGETQWNAERRLQGHLDIPLNAAGIEQAQRLGLYLRSPRFDSRIDAVVSSDLGRAYDTAVSATSHFDLPVERNPQLRERCYGIYEGQDWSNLKDLRTLAFRSPEQDIEQGESLAAFAQRVVNAFEALAQRHRGRNVMVFSHGGVIDIAWRKASAIALDAPRHAPILNVSINRFNISADGHWSAQDWGQTEHLEQTALDDVL
ncbi:histidine phosphatase family protein [Pusillimonas sp. MFBS29]|uniref:histidine phosphatase family protein n=1 Tax=Pusillimonas sp. MFBS29 TaxID=2886690 RepID=UPI001D12F59A|nr:histidine phosphatase family protein [Pusillimonas sp. MFBS29]MCC2597368.1 histidine phosphatase family protein [Pusillimonas sp. MFBS29]